MCRDKSTLKWVQGSILQQLGPRAYFVRVNGGTHHVHLDHLRKASKGAVDMEIQDRQPYVETAVEPGHRDQTTFPTTIGNGNSSPVAPSNSASTPSEIPTLVQEEIEQHTRSEQSNISDLPTPIVQGTSQVICHVKMYMERAENSMYLPRQDVITLVGNTNDRFVTVRTRHKKC